MLVHLFWTDLVLNEGAERIERLQLRTKFIITDSYIFFSSDTNSLFIHSFVLDLWLTLLLFALLSYWTCLLSDISFLKSVLVWGYLSFCYFVSFRFHYFIYWSLIVGMVVVLHGGYIYLFFCLSNYCPISSQLFSIAIMTINLNVFL